MANTCTLEIDFEIWQKIQLERTSFGDTQIQALRRLLNLATTEAALSEATPAFDETEISEAELLWAAPEQDPGWDEFSEDESTPPKPTEAAPVETNSVEFVANQSWVGEGLTLPHGTQVQMTHNQIEYSGEILDGIWIVQGHEAYTPSGAAMAVGRTKRGKPTNIDGWQYWEVKRPGDEKFVPIKQLRTI